MDVKADMDKKVVFINATELSYAEAIEVIAQWWELIRSDGINVASEVQKARQAYRKSPDAGIR